MELPLPPNFEKRFDVVSQRWYFVDHSTKKTNWDDPRPAYYSHLRSVQSSEVRNDIDPSSTTVDWDSTYSSLDQVTTHLLGESDAVYTPVQRRSFVPENNTASVGEVTRRRTGSHSLQSSNGSRRSNINQHTSTTNISSSGYNRAALHEESVGCQRVNESDGDQFDVKSTHRPSMITSPKVQRSDYKPSASSSTSSSSSQSSNTSRSTSAEGQSPQKPEQKRNSGIHTGTNACRTTHLTERAKARGHDPSLLCDRVSARGPDRSLIKGHDCSLVKGSLKLQQQSTSVCASSLA